MFLDKVGRADDENSVQVDPDLDLDFLVATIFQRFDIADFKMANVRFNDGDIIALILGLNGEIVAPVESQNLRERNLVEFREHHHVSRILLSLPEQLNRVGLE